MATVARTVALNAAFLQEIKEDHQELWSLLAATRRQMSQRHRGPLSPNRWLALLAELRDRLAMHFALEEAYGYFDDPLDVAPRLSDRAEMLRNEHAELYAQLVQVVDLAERLAYHEGPPHELVQLISQCFAEFDSRFRRHEQAERALLMESLEADLGVGD